LLCVLCQDDPKSVQAHLDEFVSKYGWIVKIEDYTLPRLILQLLYGDTQIRRLSSGDKIKVYCQVTSGNFTGSVPSEEFPQLINAFETLKIR